MKLEARPCPQSHGHPHVQLCPTKSPIPHGRWCCRNQSAQYQSSRIVSVGVGRISMGGKVSLPSLPVSWMRSPSSFFRELDSINVPPDCWRYTMSTNMWITYTRYLPPLLSDVYCNISRALSRCSWRGCWCELTRRTWSIGACRWIWVYFHWNSSSDHLWLALMVKFSSRFVVSPLHFFLAPFV